PAIPSIMRDSRSIEKASRAKNLTRGIAKNRNADDADTADYRGSDKDRIRDNPLYLRHPRWWWRRKASSMQWPRQPPHLQASLIHLYRCGFYPSAGHLWTDKEGRKATRALSRHDRPT